MRLIKFRAIMTGTDSWIIGFPREVYENGIDSIENNGGCEFINIDTLGQFTGFNDKNGIEIFEGDIIATRNRKYKYYVVFENGSFTCYHLEQKDFVNGGNLRWGLLSRAFELKDFELEIIGNIHEKQIP